LVTSQEWYLGHIQEWDYWAIREWELALLPQRECSLARLPQPEPFILECMAACQDSVYSEGEDS